MSQEIWLPIAGYGGHYQASNSGRIRSLDRRDRRGRFRPGQIIKQSADDAHYRTVVLCWDGLRRTRPVHTLVTEAFDGPRPAGMWVRHLNGNHLDNQKSNLAWGTPVQNAADTLSHGTHPQKIKTHCKRNHRLAAPNLTGSSIRTGRRGCLACSRASALARSRGEQVTQSLADQKYQSIMYEVKENHAEQCTQGPQEVGREVPPRREDRDRQVHAEG